MLMKTKEMFDISNITEEEAAVAVNESNGGFSIANKQYDTSYLNGMGGDDGYGNGIGGSGAGGSGVIGNGTDGSEIAESGTIGRGAAGSGYGSEENEANGSSHAGSNDSGVRSGGMNSDSDDANQQKKTAAESLQERVNDQMESTSPIWIHGLWQDEFTESLLRQGETKPGQPNIKTIPIKDEI